MQNQENSFTIVSNLIQKSNKILIVGPKKMSGDVYGSMIVLMIYLAKIGKRVAGFSQDTLGDRFSWSTYKNYIKQEANTIVEVDLIIVLGTSNWENLGKIFTDHRHIFLEKKTITIDHKKILKSYSAATCVDTSAVCTAEILYNLLCFIDASLFDTDIATHLLLGIVSETYLFSRWKLHAGVFHIVAELMQKYHAPYQEIVSDLYRRKKLHEILFWAELLTRMEDRWNGVIGVTISEDVRDLYEIPESHIADILHSLISSCGHMTLGYIIFQKKEEQILYIHPRHIEQMQDLDIMLNGKYMSPYEYHISDIWKDIVSVLESSLPVK